MFPSCTGSGSGHRSAAFRVDQGVIMSDLLFSQERIEEPREIIYFLVCTVKMLLFGFASILFFFLLPMTVTLKLRGTNDLFRDNVIPKGLYKGCRVIQDGM